jgi:hypothetical protein
MIKKLISFQEVFRFGLHKQLPLLIRKCYNEFGLLGGLLEIACNGTDNFFAQKNRLFLCSTLNLYVAACLHLKRKACHFQVNFQCGGGQGAP